MDAHPEYEADKAIVDILQQKGEGESGDGGGSGGESGCCCLCSGSCILIWVGLIIIHLAIFMALLQMSTLVIFFFWLLYAWVVRLCIYRAESPATVLALWMLVILAIAIAGCALATIVFPYEPQQDGLLFPRWLCLGVLLFSCVPCLVVAAVVLAMYNVMGMIAALYTLAMYSLFLILLFCGVSFEIATDILWGISYAMVWIFFIVLVRQYLSRVTSGWLLVGASICYYLFSPSAILYDSIVFNLFRLCMTFSLLFIGLMVPSSLLSLWLPMG